MSNEDLLIRIGLTEKQYLAAIARLESQSTRAANNVEKKFAQQNRAFVAGARQADSATSAFASGGLRQMSMQLSQVAQQGAATGNYLQAMAVQAADIGLAFGTAGVVVGALIPVLYGVAQGYLSAADSAEDTSEKLERFTAALKVAQDMANLAATPLDQLTEKYRQFADEVQRGAQIAAQAALSQAMRDFGEAAGGIGTALDDVVARAARYHEAMAALAIVQATLGERTISNASAFDSAERSVSEAQEAMRAAAEEIGLTALQAVDLEQALNALAKAEGMQGVADAASDALDLIDGMFDASQNIPPEVAAIVSELQAVLTAAASGVAAFDDMAAAAGGAADEAARLATNTYAAALARNYEGREDQIAPEDLPPVILPPKVSTGRRGGGRRSGGGGAGRSEAEKQQTEYARTAQRYIDQTRTAVEKYNEELRLLADLNQAGFFKDHPEAYARAVDQVTEAFQETEYSRVLKGIEDISDAMASAIVDGENLGDAMRNIFRQIARDLISSGIRKLLTDTFGLGAGGSSGGGGLLGGLFGGWFFGGVDGARAAGGPVSAGGRYLVGEKGPELFVPRTSGTIVANKDMGANVVVQPTVRVYSRDPRTRVEFDVADSAQRRREMVGAMLGDGGRTR